MIRNLYLFISDYFKNRAFKKRAFKKEQEEFKQVGEMLRKILDRQFTEFMIECESPRKRRLREQAADRARKESK